MKLLSPRQYAKIKNVHFSTVYRWIEDGKLAVHWETRKIPRIEEDATPLASVQSE
jgi:predicted site-specific integrase-resolvase